MNDTSDSRACAVFTRFWALLEKLCSNSSLKPLGACEWVQKYDDARCDFNLEGMRKEMGRREVVEDDGEFAARVRERVREAGRAQRQCEQAAGNSNNR